MPARPLPWLRRRSLAALLLGAAVLAGCSGLDTQQRKWIFQATTLSAHDDGAHIAGVDDVWIDVTGESAATASGTALTTAPAIASATARKLADAGAGTGALATLPTLAPAAATTGPRERLHALWLPGPDADAPVLLYLHGVRRNVETAVFRMENMRELGFAVLAIDYRGFGRSSELLPSEASVDEDARLAWAWLATHHPGRDRYIFGHSLGGAVAVRLATEVPDAKGLIVEGTFTSIPAVFETMKWGWLPLAPLITQRFDSADLIGRVKVPVLVVHGADDTLVPPALGRALYERATSPKRFVLVPGGTHYSTNGLAHDQYRDALHELFGLESDDDDNGVGA